MIDRVMIGRADPTARRACRNPGAHHSTHSGRAALAALCLWVLVWGAESCVMAAAGPHGVQQGKQSRRKVKNDSGDEKNLFAFDQREVLPPQALASDSVSGTTISNSLSILLTGAQVSLQGPGAPLVKTYAGTVRVPFASPERGRRIKYNQSLRGGVHKDADARVVVLLDVGGRSYKMDYPYGHKVEMEVTRFFKHSSPQAAGGYTATFFIVVERKTAAASALVSLDSLDIVAKPDSRPKGRAR